MSDKRRWIFGLFWVDWKQLDDEDFHGLKLGHVGVGVVVWRESR